MKTVFYITGVCLGLIALCLFLCMFTLGQVLHFENYSPLAWVLLLLCITATVCMSIFVADAEYQDWCKGQQDKKA